MNSLEIRNFKRFGKISVKLHNTGLTLISGSNNSGKTSILHALAVWEYSKMLLVNARGDRSLTQDYNFTNGLGIPPESFSPISIPSLRYLWKDQNTNGSYKLTIKVGWKEADEDQQLELAYSLNGNNFAIKKSASTLKEQTAIPIIAYLPPFGGMSENETWLSNADRRKLIGKGQAGSVIRNLLLDLYNAHEEKIRLKKTELMAGRTRLPKSEKALLDSVDTEWRQLEKILMDVFSVTLKPQPFDSNFHNFVHIDVMDVDKTDGTKKSKNSSRRDLMIEGSGFLQWVSVFALALDPNNHVLLLDEPDAHLHASLQSLLLKKLEGICESKNKQILMVSHSPELIKLIDYQKILHVEDSKAEYLRTREQKVLVLEGLGSKYFPLLDDIIKHNKVLLVENDSDTRALRKLCGQLGLNWPTNLVEWVTNKKHSERKTLILELNQKIMQQTGRPIAAYSLRDLDDQGYSTTTATLAPSGQSDQFDDSGKHKILRYRTLRRREIENYLIIPSALSRYITKIRKTDKIATDIDAVNDYLREEHGLFVPKSHKSSDRASNTEPLFSKDCKQILEGIRQHFKVKFNKEAYVAQIEQNEIPEDMTTIIKELIDMCNT